MAARFISYKAVGGIVHVCRQNSVSQNVRKIFGEKLLNRTFPPFLLNYSEMLILKFLKDSGVEAS